MNEFASPVIPRIFTSVFHCNFEQQRIDKSYYICNYSEDIFQSLRENELTRRLVCFRSQQICERPMLLKLLKTASEAHKLSRTSLHLAVYLLDCFMDNYTIRYDKLNLSAITCLIVAAKIEEADVDMPKFADLNKLCNEDYTLNEFRNVECKVLGSFNFDLIRPTAATFAEYFANSIITLQDYHGYINHWNNEIIINNYHQQQQDLQTQVSSASEEIINASCIVLSALLPYTSYENMLLTLNKTFFDLIDISLSYLKFANARPSIIASACIAAVRQLYGIFPIWTAYLIKMTHSTADMILPFVETILALYRMHYSNNYFINSQTTPTPLSSACQVPILCESPDSGIVSSNDTKSTTSDTDNEDDRVVNLNIDAKNISSIPLDSDDNEDEAYHCLEYTKQAKRRRLL